MNIYIDHEFHYETENLVRLFFPNEKITVLQGTPEHIGEKDIISSVKDGKIYTEFSGESADCQFEDTDTKIIERKMAVCLYEVLVKVTGRKQPWGILTGVRPIKLFRRLSEIGGKDYAGDYFMNKLLVSEGSYCSFVSQSIEKAQKLIEPYFELLCREIEYTAEIAKKCELQLESVYVGGGTPTTLNAEQLAKLIDTVNQNFDMATCREFTVEAGRPDTIDRDKLTAVLKGGADRISINPQTLNDKVLEVIGRKHNSQQTFNAYQLAREIGFKHINMDLIAGLPTDTVESFKNTLDKICELSPESITVHTLAMKRSSRLTQEGNALDTDKEVPAGKMLRYCEEKLFKEGYHPYYLYRQTRMEGNLENVGWSKDGYDGIYNVFVMDETHTILGCGAGAVSKLKKPLSEELSRIFNYKYPYEYINGFEEMLRRKEQVKEFYDELAEYLSEICV